MCNTEHVKILSNLELKRMSSP